MAIYKIREATLEDAEDDREVMDVTENVFIGKAPDFLLSRIAF